MPSEKDNILELLQYMKSDTLFMLILNLCLPIHSIDEWANNPENYSTTKID